MKFMHPEVILTWPKPNYVNPEKRGSELFFINSIFFALATSAICIRLYTRLFIRKWFGLDDWLILLAWLFGAGDIATVYYSFHHFWWDRHMWDAKPSMLEPGAKAMFPAKIFWATCSTCVRLSLLVLYYRLLDHMDVHNWRYRWIIHANVFMVVGILMSSIFTTIFACNSIEQYWHWPPKGYCISEGYSLLILSCLNTFSEALVATLPIPMILRLGMISRQRISVLILFCLGFLVSVVGAVRCYFLYMIFWTDDMTWYASPHWICSEVEISVAMICACAPALGLALKRVPLKQNPIAWVRKVFSRFQQNFRERKSSRSNLYLSSNGKFRESIDNISFIREHNQYCRTVDVEGIGNDGFGYTVTITTARPSAGKKSTLRKLVFPEEHDGMHSKKLDTSIQAPRRPLYKMSQRRSSDVVWPLPNAIEVEKGFDVETQTVRHDEREHGRPSRHTSVSYSDGTPRQMLEKGRRRASEEYREYAVRHSGPHSYFYETETEEDLT